MTSSPACPLRWWPSRNRWPTPSWPGSRPSTGCSPRPCRRSRRRPSSRPRHLQTGPVALTALLTFGALSGQAPTGTAEFARLAALLALLVGAFRLLLGLIRLGRLAYLLSEPVLAGFTTGAAVLIISSQLPRVFDATGGDGGVLRNALDAVTSPGEWQLGALVFALGTAAVIVGGRRLHRLFPGRARGRRRRHRRPRLPSATRVRSPAS